MSLTSLIKNDKNLTAKIKSAFKRPKLDKSKPLLAKPLTKNYGTVGVAFDYLFRFYLEKNNSINNSNITRWTSESACNYLDDETRIVAESIIADVKKLKNEYIKTGLLSRDLIRQTIRMSYIDPVYRSGFGAEYIGTNADELDIDDIETQFKLIEPGLYKSENVCLLNPTFYEASSLVGGADADFIFDGKLIDIKTTKNLNLKLNDFYQIIGYLLLYRISGVFCNYGIEDSEINQLGLYYSRYSYLFLFDVNEIIKPKSLDKFTTWFEQYIHDYADKRYSDDERD